MWEWCCKILSMSSGGATGGASSQAGQSGASNMTSTSNIMPSNNFAKRVYYNFHQFSFLILCIHFNVFYLVQVSTIMKRTVKSDTARSTSPVIHPPIDPKGNIPFTINKIYLSQTF